MHFFNEKLLPTEQLKEQLAACLEKRDLAIGNDDILSEIAYDERVRQLETELTLREGDA